MAATDVSTIAISDDEHRRELRKAVIAHSARVQPRQFAVTSALSVRS